MRVVAFAAALAAMAASSGRAAAQETQVPTLKAAAAAAPGDAEGVLSLGRALRRAGHLREARALAASPAGAMRVDWEIERLEADRRDFIQASVVCKDIASLPGMKAEGHACLAAAQLVRQRATEALAETQLALAGDPRSFEARLAEGHAYALQL